MNSHRSGALPWAVNGISFIVISVLALVINLIVGKYYGPAGLGVYNQSIAFYVFGGQLAAFGIPVALTKYLSETRGENRIDALVGSALRTMVPFSLLTAVGLLGLRGLLGRWMQSPLLDESLLWIATAVVFFAFNKLVLGYLNGTERMVLYGVFRLARVVLLTVILMVLISAGYDAVAPALAIMLSEALLAAAGFVLIHRSLGAAASEQRTGLMSFGFKSAVNGVVIELNTRIDIIFLGLLCTDELVGFYSMAAMLSEGYFQMFTVGRAFVNPAISRLSASQDWKGILSLMKRYVGKTYLIAGIGFSIGAIIYPHFCNWYDARFISGYTAFVILTAAISVLSPALVFGNLLTFIGKPDAEALSTLSTAISNGIMNYLLITPFGISGAAAATAISMAVGTIIQLLLFAAKMKSDSRPQAG